MSKKKRGIHIVFEGLDGGGKSVQAYLLTKRLRRRGFVVYNWRERPPHIAKQITKITSDPKNINMAITGETLIYAARLAQIIQEGIIPHLNQGHIVVSVRYTPSLITLAHFIRGVEYKFIKTIVEFINQAVPVDMIILCDADPESAYQNVINRGQALDRRELEGVKHFELMRKGFLQLAHYQTNWHIFETLKRSKVQIADQIWDKVSLLVK